jgi:hypothetical protein
MVSDTASLAPGTTVALVGWGVDDSGRSGERRCVESFVATAGDHEVQVGFGTASPRACVNDSGGPVFVALPDGVGGTVDVAVASHSHAMDDTGCERGGVATRWDGELDATVATVPQACAAARVCPGGAFARVGRHTNAVPRLPVCGQRRYRHDCWTVWRG